MTAASRAAANQAKVTADAFLINAVLLAAAIQAAAILSKMTTAVFLVNNDLLTAASQAAAIPARETTIAFLFNTVLLKRHCKNTGNHRIWTWTLWGKRSYAAAATAVVFFSLLQFIVLRGKKLFGLPGAGSALSEVPCRGSLLLGVF